MSGVTCLEKKVYIIYRLSNTIRVFTTDMRQEEQVITIEEMRFPLDITACQVDRKLYVADSGSCLSDGCIWGVSPENPSEQVKLALTDEFQALSVKSPNLLLTSPRSLHQYHTADGQLMRTIVLPDYVTLLYHGVETTRGTLVVGHRGMEKSKNHAAVGRLLNIHRLSSSQDRIQSMPCPVQKSGGHNQCLLYTSDAADE